MSKQYVEQAIGFLKENPNTAVDFLMMVGAKKSPESHRDLNQQIFHEMKKEMIGNPREAFMVFAIGRDGNLLDHAVMFRGLETAVQLSLQAIFRWLLTRDDHVTEFFIAHNHPIGKALPSIMDIDVTFMVRNYGSGLGLNLSDHFIIGLSGNITSVRKKVNQNFDQYGTPYGSQYMNTPAPHDPEIVRRLFSDGDFIMEQLKMMDNFL